MKFPRSLYMQLNFVCAFAVFCSIPAAAQSAQVKPRVTQAVDAGNMVVLRGNTHPLARPENDRGAASDSLPVNRMRSSNDSTDGHRTLPSLILRRSS